MALIAPYFMYYMEPSGVCVHVCGVCVVCREHVAVTHVCADVVRMCGSTVVVLVVMCCNFSFELCVHIFTCTVCTQINEVYICIRVMCE